MVGFVVAGVTTPGRAIHSSVPSHSDPATLASPVHEYLPDVAQVPGIEFLLALFIIVAGIYLSKLLVRLLGRPVARRFTRQSVAHTVLRAVRVFTVVGALVLAGWIAGLGLPDLALSAAVFSAVVGIILAPVIANVINGLFVLADQPFEIGDMIELDDGTQGFVDDITIRYTKVITLDNTFLVIPNENIRERDVTNYSAEDERTRLSLPLLVTYESDVPRARQIMERAARECEAVVDGGPDIRIGAARYPASPTAYIDEYADNGVLLTLRYWVKRPYRLLSLRSTVQERVWTALEQEDVDVEIAYPHQHLVFDETSGTAQVSVSDGLAEYAVPPASAVTETEAEAGEESDGTIETGGESADGGREGLHDVEPESDDDNPSS